MFKSFVSAPSATIALCLLSAALATSLIVNVYLIYTTRRNISGCCSGKKRSSPTSGYHVYVTKYATITKPSAELCEWTDNNLS